LNTSGIYNLGFACQAYKNSLALKNCEWLWKHNLTSIDCILVLLSWVYYGLYPSVLHHLFLFTFGMDFVLKQNKGKSQGLHYQSYHFNCFCIWFKGKFQTIIWAHCLLTFWFRLWLMLSMWMSFELDSIDTPIACMGLNLLALNGVMVLWF